METQEHWNQFLNKEVKVIVEDAPSPYPKMKEGYIEEITSTHLILKRETKTEALRLNDIRRVEIIRGE